MYFLHVVTYAAILLFKLQGMNTDWGFYLVLGLDGTMLVFFTAAHLVPCFGFVIKKVLVTHQPLP